jgi:hydrogenase small subunit
MQADLTRREFLGSGAGAAVVLTVSLVGPPGLLRRARAVAPKKRTDIPVIWMATGACSGCSVALLNSSSPSIQEVLLEEVLPGAHLSLKFHATVMASAGEKAMGALDKVAKENKGQYVLVVDGATATKEEGLYCCVGERDGRAITGYDQVRDLSQDARAVLAVGACAAYGGIPAAPPNPTGAVPVSELLTREGISAPYVNIPGCPPHPDWIVGTIASLLLGGLEALELDELHRPGPFFKECIHDNCSYRGHFERGEFADFFGEHGCLLKLGCKGPITFADCPIRKFNNGTSWCCEAGHPCIGCCHPDFPFEGSMFTPVEPAQFDFPTVFPSVGSQGTRKEADADTYTAVGLIGVGGFLAGAGVVAAAKKLKTTPADDSAGPVPTAPKGIGDD